MKSGDRFRCPACHEDSIVKSRKKMDGFQCIGEELVCMLCGAALPSEPEAKENTEKKPNPLAAFLGVEESAPERLSDDGSHHFCRDCKYYISHPFLSRCDKFSKAVNPMDDCPAFEPKSNQHSTGNTGKDF